MYHGSALRVTSDRHVRATASGGLALTISGPSGQRATVTLTSQRRIPSRWLERGRPRVVTLGRREFVLSGEGRARVVLRLSPQHLALLRRMAAVTAVARVTADGSSSATEIIVHAPRRHTGRRRPRCGECERRC